MLQHHQESCTIETVLKKTEKGDGKCIVWSIPGNPTNFQDLLGEMKHTEVLRTCVTISHSFYMVSVTLCRKSIEPKIGEFFFPIGESKYIENLRIEFPQLFGIKGILYDC